MKAASEEVTRCGSRTHAEIYLEVSGIDALWEHVKTVQGALPHSGLIRPREYGMTEFHILDPNGCLVFVGEATRKQ
jgi:hypothetical protein